MATTATKHNQSKTVRTISKAPAAAKPAACAHHWVIESPDGEMREMSRGVCKLCGATKQFPNAAEDWLWERDVPQSRWTGRSDGAPSY